MLDERQVPLLSFPPSRRWALSICLCQSHAKCWQHTDWAGSGSLSRADIQAARVALTLQGGRISVYKPRTSTGGHRCHQSYGWMRCREPVPWHGLGWPTWGPDSWAEVKDKHQRTRREPRYRGMAKTRHGNVLLGTRQGSGICSFIQHSTTQA